MFKTKSCTFQLPACIVLVTSMITTDHILTFWSKSYFPYSIAIVEMLI